MSANQLKRVRRNLAPWLAWPLMGFTLLCVCAMLLLMAKGCSEILAGDGVVERIAPFVLSASNLLFALLGLLIIYRRPGHAIGWLCAVIGTVGAFREYLLIHAHCEARALPVIDFANWSYYVISPLSTIPMFLLLPMLFPDGRFLSSRWRLFTIIGCGLLFVQLAFIAALPGPLLWNGMEPTDALDNPFALDILPETAGPAMNVSISIVLTCLSLAGILSLVVRYRRSQGEVRQQLKWIAYFFAVVVGTQGLFFEIPGAFITPKIFDGVGYALIITAVFLGYPIVIGIAILRYRLYDIDIIIRRTLVYTLVTATLALIYLGSVVLLQQLFGRVTGQQSTLAIVLSTLLIATLFNPLRRRTQRLIERRFYRRRYNAQRVLERFAEASRSEVDLGALEVELASVVSETMLPESVSIWLKGSGQPHRMGRSQ